MRTNGSFQEYASSPALFNDATAWNSLCLRRWNRQLYGLVILSERLTLFASDEAFSPPGAETFTATR